jgi:hypothetical protein
MNTAAARPARRALIAAPCTGLIVLAARGIGAAPRMPGRCPRPSDRYGPRYATISGAYRSRGVSAGGGKFVTLMPPQRAATASVNVTDAVFGLAGRLPVGTPITLFGYVENSLSGASPPYSCIEFAPARRSPASLPLSGD